MQGQRSRFCFVIVRNRIVYALSTILSDFLHNGGDHHQRSCVAAAVMVYHYNDLFGNVSLVAD
jgi:hypothetical protein